jgi:hypothetical protein
MPELSFDGNICGLTMTSTVPPGQASLHPTQALRAWLWSLAIKELGRSVEHSGTELWLGFSGVVIQGGFGPEVGKTFGSYRGVP